MLKRPRLSLFSRQGASLLALMLYMCLGLGACSQPCTSCSYAFSWQEQPGQLAATGPAGSFAVKWIQVTPQQLQFYYIFLSTQHNSLQVTASASHLSNTTSARSLATTVQVLGQISGYSIGVIHVDWANHVNQLIGLQLTLVSPTGAPAATWQLTPLQQVSSDPHPDGRFQIDTSDSGLPEADWFVAHMGAHTVSYVKIILPGQPVADRSYVFVRSDDPLTVTVITKAEYLAIAGPENFTL
jgi:hypothetical protein